MAERIVSERGYLSVQSTAGLSDCWSRAGPEFWATNARFSRDKHPSYPRRILQMHEPWDRNPYRTSELSIMQDISILSLQSVRRIVVLTTCG